MKELSIEEKAKRYDEAIEVARKIKNGEPINVSDGTPIPVAIFPELKESEDENIRKDIVEAVELHKGFTQGRKEHIYAWLEKQGEQKLDNKVEQKPTIEMITTEESLGIDSETYNKVVDECVYGEQKPAWSEEDERIFKNTIALIETLEDYNKAPDGFGDVKFWLKSLKERISKFDEGYKVGFSAAKHNQWKPSDGQIASLTIACDRNDRIGFELTQLLRDLKKLKKIKL